jgi:hypothetical protein
MKRRVNVKSLQLTATPQQPVTACAPVACRCVITLRIRRGITKHLMKYIY